MKRRRFNGKDYNEAHLDRLENPGSKPVKWNESFVKRVYLLALLGLTDSEIATALEVSKQTIDYWKRTKKEFTESLNRGKIEADTKVARALFKRALGYSHDDVHITNFQGVITQTKIVKHYPPDTTAAIFWLKNRQRALWTDALGKLAENINIQVNNIDFSQFTDQELKQLEQIGLNQEFVNGNSDTAKD